MVGLCVKNHWYIGSPSFLESLNKSLGSNEILLALEETGIKHKEERRDLEKQYGTFYSYLIHSARDKKGGERGGDGQKRVR